MLPTSLYIFSGILAIASRVSAHGLVTGIVAGGKNYPVPEAPDTGFVSPDGYGTPDIICHDSATAAGVSVPVEAGSTVDLQWTEWPETHHGPVIDYLANCNGPCDTVDKASLKFNKIDAVGIIDQSTGPGAVGVWASDKLREASNTWTVTIPSTIAKGNYVLRHEIIGLHDARTGASGAQNYPHCVNLKVSGSGTDSLSTGTLGTALYERGDPGIEIDIYKPLDSSYQMPGPALYKAGSTASSETSASSGLDGGLSNFGMSGEPAGSNSVASQSATTVSSAAANVVSASMPVYTSTSPSALTTGIPMATPPWSNSTGANMTTTTSPLPITPDMAAMTTSLPATDAMSSAAAIVNNVSNPVGSVQVNTLATSTSTSSYPPSTAQPAMQTPIPEAPTEKRAQDPSAATPTAAAPTSDPNTNKQPLPPIPDPAMFAALNVNELFQYLKAITAALGNKMEMDAGAGPTAIAKRSGRRHARDVRNL